ncbi:hypothetical protein [Bradyrhizobium sp. 21]|uniref:hypothetical protein n=1 Tax=Bradyrhizobium sp. 21 TaxID=2782666 RepID=UPI001FFBC7AE|nr:hypothetical protein [Bradyrhizobium sp. 21]MCK1387549.1 hypothetical protein [Bradyrhizobium sp. 21]
MTDQAILATGAADFIGFQVARQLLGEGRPVVGPDNLNSYYDPASKQARLAPLRGDLFANAIMADRPIRLFNHGKMRRGFTYIDDVTRVVSKLIDRVPADELAAANAPSKVDNVGNHPPEELMHVVGLLEQELGRTAVEESLPMQPEDVLETFADVEDLMRDTGFAPSTPIAHGVRNFVTWSRLLQGLK